MADAHEPNWSSGRCVVCAVPWPCSMAQLILEASHLDAPKALRAHMEDVAAGVDPRWRDQILAWLDAP